MPRVDRRADHRPLDRRRRRLAPVAAVAAPIARHRASRRPARSLQPRPRGLDPARGGLLLRPRARPRLRRRLGIDEALSWTLLWSLLVFNVGIETVQLAIILAVFPALALLRRRAPRRRALGDRGDRRGRVRRWAWSGSCSASRNLRPRHNFRQAQRCACVTFTARTPFRNGDKALISLNGREHDEVRQSHGRRAGRRRVAVGATAAVMAPRRAFGIGSTAIGRLTSERRRASRHHPRRRRQRVAARRVLVLLGRHRAGGRRSRRPPSSSTASSPASAVTFPATVAANTRQRRLQRPRHDRRPAGEHRVLLPRRHRGRLVPDVLFRTQRFEGDFDFLFFGDPQIGSSGNVAKDGAGWAGHPERRPRRQPERRAAGVGRRPGRDRQHRDAVERVPRAPTSCASTRGPRPSATTTSAARRTSSTSGRRTPTAPRRSTTATRATRSGGDYWYIYKGVLFIDLNSNAYATPAPTRRTSATSPTSSRQHGAEAKYTVLVYHHSIYSPADHANDGDNQLRRQDFPTAFSNLGVDLVLQGHDHSYSRSYVIKNGAKADPNEKPGAADVAAGPSRRRRPTPPPPVAPAPKPPVAPPTPPQGLQVQAVDAPQVQSMQAMQYAEQRRDEYALETDSAAVAYAHPPSPLPWEIAGGVAVLALVLAGGGSAGRSRSRAGSPRPGVGRTARAAAIAATWRWSVPQHPPSTVRCGSVAACARARRQGRRDRPASSRSPRRAPRGSCVDAFARTPRAGDPGRRPSTASKCVGCAQLIM